LRVKHFKTILANRSYQLELPTSTEVLAPESHHENVRGQGYYE